MSNRKLMLYISMSLDGFIATKDDDISWLSMVDQEGEDYGYHAFVENIDAYIIGNATYKKVLELTGGKFPQAEQFDCYVITRTEQAPENGVTFYTQPIKQLIEELRQQSGKHIYCDGGGQIVQLLMQEELIDEYIISVIPMVLGDGKRLFRGGVPQAKLKLVESKTYEKGLVQLHYVKA